MNIHALSRDIVSKILYLTKITHPRNRHRDRLLIATFHRVLPEHERKQYPYPALVVTPEELHWLLIYFKKNYTCGHLSEIHSRYSSRERPKKPFLAITFDDGQLDNYRYAKPVLDEFNIKASFFIPVKHIEDSTFIWHDHLGFAVLNATKTEKDKKALQAILLEHGIVIESGRWTSAIVKQSMRMMPDDRNVLIDKVNAVAKANIPEWARLMEWEHIKRLADDGHEIGSHTMTHPLLPQCNDSELEFELFESKNILEHRVNKTIDSFCYPNGDHDQRTINAVQKAGYQRAITTCWGANKLLDNIHTLKRCDIDASRVRNISQQLSEEIIALRLSGLHPGL